MTSIPAANSPMRIVSSDMLKDGGSMSVRTDDGRTFVIHHQGGAVYPSTNSKRGDKPVSDAIQVAVVTAYAEYKQRHADRRSAIASRSGTPNAAPVSGDITKDPICSWLTHIDAPEDKPFLRSRLLDVNIRMFIHNPSYRAIILSCCDHLCKVCMTTFPEYKTPHGVSGANCAIPFNIIAITKHRGTSKARPEVMINPHIVAYRGTPFESLSNCGSIRLKEPIRVSRYPGVRVMWYDTKGDHHESELTTSEGSLTIQHEVDHNQGLLITDRQVKTSAASELDES